ncbi:MAG: TRAP transporter substrate-binding protein DctP [Nitrospirae bacterium]|nr:TRAP transporter substrate-binding protein DctP [Nitrospirota bacterium]
MALRRSTAPILAIAAAALFGETVWSAGAEKNGSGPEITLKVGTLAPESASLIQEAKEGFREVTEKSQGRVRIVLYSGGVLGDERDMVRKLQIGQIDAVVVSGMLGALVPEMTVISLPFVFRSFDEFDALRDGLFERFSAAFEKQGLALLVWFDIGGFTQLFSAEPVRSLDDLAKRKVWIWPGMPLADAAVRDFPMQAVPLDAPSVLMGFQTGMLDTMFSNPLAILLFQVQKQVKYMTRLDFSLVPVALLTTKKRFYEIPPDLREVILATLARYGPRLTLRARRDDDTALKALIRSGIEVVRPTPEAMVEFQKTGEKVWNTHADKLYPRAWLDEFQAALGQVRAAR